jgi:hypothetical protein
MPINQKILSLRRITEALDALRNADYERAIELATENDDGAFDPITLKTANKIVAQAAKKLGQYSSLSSEKTQYREKQLTPINARPGQGVHSTAVDTQNRVAVGYCLLMMRSEKNITTSTLSALLQQIGPNDHIFVLFNGFEDQILKAHLQKHKGISCSQSNSNLGVAGGRNLLYKKVLIHKPAISHVVNLDNDVLIPLDLNDQIKKEIIDVYDSRRIGVLGGVILNYAKDQCRKYIQGNFIKFRGYLDVDCYNVFCEDLFDYLKYNNPKEILWHIGMHKDYRRVYLERVDLFPPFKGEKKFEPFLANSEGLAGLLGSHTFEVSNVPGCFQIFSVDHLKAVGLLENRFSPYYFEDSEFCIRSLLINKQNLISTNLILMHGTDERHKNRKSGIAKFQHFVNEYRARYILFRTLGEPNPVEKLIDQARKVTSSDSGRAPDDKMYGAALEGIRKGVNQYGGMSSLEDIEALSKETAVRVIESAYSVKSDPGRLPHDGVSSSENLPGSNEALPRVYFQRLKKFRDAYKDQDCLLICNGPSLKKTRLGLFAGIPTFAVNSTFILSDEIGFLPTFYTVEDNHVVADNLAEIKAFGAETKFFPEKYRELIGDQEGIFYLPANWDCYFGSKVSFENPEFSKDVTRVIYTGQTVTYLNLQLAFYMGFRRIFIVGLDFSYSVPRGARIAGNSIDQDEDDLNHFHPSYFGKGKQWHFPKLDSCLSSYSIARQVFESDGREIIDLTIDGKLNVFPNRSVDELIPEAAEIPIIADGLNFSQYILDYTVSLAVRYGFKFRLTDVLPRLSDEENVIIFNARSDWDGELVAEALRLYIDALGKFDEFYCLIYSEVRVFVFTNDLSYASMLPFFEWVQSSLAVAYVEVDLSHKEWVPNVYPYFLPRQCLNKCSDWVGFLNSIRAGKAFLLTPKGLYVRL